MLPGCLFCASAVNAAHSIVALLSHFDDTSRPVNDEASKSETSTH
jgi:hypothetical protein